MTPPPEMQAAKVGELKLYAVKLRRFPDPHVLYAPSRAAARYRSAKAAVAAGYGGREGCESARAMSMAWHSCEWVHRVLTTLETAHEED